MNRRTANNITALATGLLVFSALSGGALARGGGGDNGNNHRNDRQQHSDSKPAHSADNQKRGGTKNSQASRTNAGRIAASLGDSKQRMKPPKMTIHPIVSKKPVATTAAPTSRGGADKPDASGKTTPTTTSTVPVSKPGTVAVVPPTNTIAPIVAPTGASPATPAPTASAAPAPAPIVRDHTHPVGAAPTTQGDISLSAGSKAPPAGTAISSNAPPAAANPHPESQTPAPGFGNQVPVDPSATPNPNHEATRTNSKPVGVTDKPFVPNIGEDGPKQTFNVILSHDNRDGRKPLECGAQPGCDISASLRSIEGPIKTDLLAAGAANAKMIDGIGSVAKGAYNTVKSWF